ncbi:hypothetical protein MNQ98_14445 [Paenibacillus sp. N3/727]|uniref:hypothetical protein n=1 Tax=Paenibacillus sp. N3/727 TaxID=2925845 RepID=UPI001F53D4B2|nr:hypothetical protein [Paenibacillus sp. N3/727]UNK21135.1 hypothetical protein MNQ98_14445 [Paenibacillus sp. N3/727]
MSENQQSEYSQTQAPEVGEQTISEFEQPPTHPDRNSTRVKSEEIRYPNADQLYK